MKKKDNVMHHTHTRGRGRMTVGKDDVEDEVEHEVKGRNTGGRKKGHK